MRAQKKKKKAFYSDEESGSDEATDSESDDSDEEVSAQRVCVRARMRCGADNTGGPVTPNSCTPSSEYSHPLLHPVHAARSAQRASV